MLQGADDHVRIVSVKIEVLSHFERPVEFHFREADRNLAICFERPASRAKREPSALEHCGECVADLPMNRRRCHQVRGYGGLYQCRAMRLAHENRDDGGSIAPALHSWAI